MATTGALALAMVVCGGASVNASVPIEDLEPDGPDMTYLVLSSQDGSRMEEARASVDSARGSVVAAYGQIGVLVARSADPAFAAELRGGKGVDRVGATRDKAKTDATGPTTTESADGPTEGPPRNDVPQWDMDMINVKAAHAVTEGSPSVVVGIHDSGVDDTHEAFAANFDRSRSVDCTSGAPDTSDGAWRPGKNGSGHGTHVAGTVAAQNKGKGVAGVAPKAKIAAVKVSDEHGDYSGEAAVCGFMWAAEKRLPVSNHSYYVDWHTGENNGKAGPFMSTKDDDQSVVIEAVSRAAAHSRAQGVLNIAAAGNEGLDLPGKANVTELLADTVRIPAELPGMLTVSSMGPTRNKAMDSNYGQGVIALAAPGGDGELGLPEEESAVLSTAPGNRYEHRAGTSMAAPHVSGTAALILSRTPHLTPGTLSERLLAAARPVPCPSSYEGLGGIPRTCTGAPADNSFYGRGLIDAHAAVTESEPNRP